LSAKCKGKEYGGEKVLYISPNFLAFVFLSLALWYFGHALLVSQIISIFGMWAISGLIYTPPSRE
jgi:hypothetical protein